MSEWGILDGLNIGSGKFMWNVMWNVGNMGSVEIVGVNVMMLTVNLRKRRFFLVNLLADIY